MEGILKTSNQRLLALIVFYLFYLFIGASIFDALESPHEKKVVNDLNRYVQAFRRQHNSCLTNEELNAFIKVISIANDKGVPAIRNVSKDQNWSFGQAVFFAGTVLTTIGYGNVSPLTKTGKIFCILFALVGIPATLLLLYAIIERLMSFTGFLLSLFTDKMKSLLNSKIGLFEECVQRSHMHILFSLLCGLLVLIFFFLIPAKIYSEIEHWSFLNAFYYCFISLSTVGLGDYVPGDKEFQENRHLYKICSTIYLILGVMVMVWLLQIFSETPEFNIYKYFTLTKDGILTSHRDTMHPATPSSASNSNPTSSSINMYDNSSVIYQRQLNEAQQHTNIDDLSQDHAKSSKKPETTNLTDESNLINTGLAQKEPTNYYSLDSVKPDIIP